MRYVSALLLSAAVAFAASPKTYQVTGPVTDVKDGLVTVQKGKESWQIDASSVAPAGLKVGDKVTVTYVMTAKSVDVKAADAKGKKK